MIDPYGKKDLVLLSLPNAAATTIPGPICAMDLSEKNGKLAYAVLSKIGAVEKSQLHMRDLSTGQDQVFARHIGSKKLADKAKAIFEARLKFRSPDIPPQKP